jgi:hypothetical protein
LSQQEELEDAVLYRHKGLMLKKTSKLLKKEEGAWDNLSELLSSSGGNNTAEVTKTLDRTVYPTEDLATSIGVMDFMCHAPKKKMLVKNSETAMSDTTMALLEAVRRAMPDLRDLSAPGQIHYRVNPAKEREDRLGRFKNADQGILCVVGMMCQGTDIPSINAVMPWDVPIDKPLRVLEKYVYSRSHVQFVGRPCRVDKDNPDKTHWYYCLPGIELELDLDEDLTKERLKDLLKGLNGIQFGIYSAYSVFNKEHSNDGNVTFYVPAPKSVSDSRSKGNNEKPRKQCGQLINKYLTIELSSEDIENVRKCIEAREQLGWPEKYAAHEQAMLGDPEKRKLWDEVRVET